MSAQEILQKCASKICFSRVCSSSFNRSVPTLLQVHSKSDLRLITKCSNGLIKTLQSCSISIFVSAASLEGDASKSFHWCSKEALNKCFKQCFKELLSMMASGLLLDLLQGCFKKSISSSTRLLQRLSKNCSKDYQITVQNLFNSYSRVCTSLLQIHSKDGLRSGAKITGPNVLPPAETRLRFCSTETEYWRLRFCSTKRAEFWGSY